MNDYKNMHENIDKLYDIFTSYSNFIPCHSWQPYRTSCEINKFFKDLGIVIDVDELCLNQIYFDSKIQTIFNSNILNFDTYYNKIDTETYYFNNQFDNSNKKLYLSNSFKLWCELVFSVLSLLKKHKYGFFQCKYKIFSPFICIINAIYDVYFINRNYKRIKYFISRIDECEKFIEIDYKRHRRELLKEKIKNICKEEI